MKFLSHNTLGRWGTVSHCVHMCCLWCTHITKELPGQALFKQCSNKLPCIQTTTKISASKVSTYIPIMIWMCHVHAHLFNRSGSFGGGTWFGFLGGWVVYTWSSSDKAPPRKALSSSFRSSSSSYHKKLPTLLLS